MQRLTLKTLTLGLAAVAALATTLPAAAQFQKPEDFTVMGAHFGRLGAMVQGRVPFDAATATMNADIVAEMSKLPYAGFVEGTSGTEKGSPKPNVWTERAKFDEAAKKMQTEVVKLAAASKSLDTLKVAFAAAAGACKACHDDFRNP